MGHSYIYFSTLGLFSWTPDTHKVSMASPLGEYLLAGLSGSNPRPPGSSPHSTLNRGYRVWLKTIPCAQALGRGERRTARANIQPMLCSPSQASWGYNCSEKRASFFNSHKGIYWIAATLARATVVTQPHLKPCHDSPSQWKQKPKSLLWPIKSYKV